MRVGLREGPGDSVDGRTTFSSNVAVGLEIDEKPQSADS